MDIKEFEARLEKIVLETGPNPVDDTGGHDFDRRKALFDDLEQELRGETTSGTDGCANIEMLLQILRSIRESLTDPDYKASAARLEAHEPQIFDEIERGDLEAVAASLEKWDVNARYGEYKKTALYCAMSSMEGGSVEMVSLLLDAGADPRLGLGDGNALHGLAFGNWNTTAVADLYPVIVRCVALGADLEERTNKLGWTPLMTAVSEWNAVASEALLLAGADIDVRAETGEDLCLSGGRLLDFARGHPQTTAVLKVFLARQ